METVDEKTVSKPWDQREGENTRWYSRFREFLDLGPTRSVLGLYKHEAGKSKKRNAPTSWNEAAERFAWRSRAEAWDQEQLKIKEQEALESRKQENARLLKQREEQRAREIALAEKLFIKASELLEQPSEVEKESEEEGLRIFVPNFQGFRTAAAMVKEFRETGRTALNMPIQRTSLDISKLSDDDLLALYESIRSDGGDETETEEGEDTEETKEDET